jgi:hypothetical protein
VQLIIDEARYFEFGWENINWSTTSSGSTTISIERIQPAIPRVLVGFRDTHRHLAPHAYQRFVPAPGSTDPGSQALRNAENKKRDRVFQPNRA